jgi:sugar phosphate isomerase/epimerase
MPDKYTLGAALPVDLLESHKDWLLAGQRDLEIQDAFRPDVLDGDWRAVVARAKEALRGHTGRVGIHGPFDGIQLLSIDAKVQQLAEARLLQGLNFAEELGATHMVVHSPFLTLGNPFVPIPPSYARQELLKRIRDVIGRVVVRAESLGCMLVIENIFDLNPEPWMWLITSLDSRFVRASVDVGHAQCMHEHGGASPDAFIRAAGPYLTHVHVQDTDGLSDRHWAPGEGCINWHGVFEALDAATGATPRLLLELRDYSRIQKGEAHLKSLGLVA